MLMNSARFAAPRDAELSSFATRSAPGPSWTVGTVRTTIGRHGEISEGTAEAPYRYVECPFGSATEVVVLPDEPDVGEGAIAVLAAGQLLGR